MQFVIHQRCRHQSAFASDTADDDGVHGQAPWFCDGAMVARKLTTFGMRLTRTDQRTIGPGTCWRKRSELGSVRSKGEIWRGAMVTYGWPPMGRQPWGTAPATSDRRSGL